MFIWSWSRAWKCCSYWGWTELSSIRPATVLKHSAYWTTTHTKVEYEGRGIFYEFVWKHNCSRGILSIHPVCILSLSAASYEHCEQSSQTYIKVLPSAPQEELEEIRGSPMLKQKAFFPAFHGTKKVQSFFFRCMTTVCFLSCCKNPDVSINRIWKTMLAPPFLDLYQCVQWVYEFVESKFLQVCSKTKNNQLKEVKKLHSAVEMVLCGFINTIESVTVPLHLSHVVHWKYWWYLNVIIL